VQLESRDPTPIVFQPEKFSPADAQLAERARAPTTMAEPLSAQGRMKGFMLMMIFGLSNHHMWWVTTLKGLVITRTVPVFSAAAGACAFQPTFYATHSVKDTAHLQLLSMDTRR
jgi:hypothetical protein